MDPSKGKQHSSYRGYKSTSSHGCHNENYYSSTQSNHGIFRTRIQRHTLKWRKDHQCRENYRSKFPYRKSDINNKKSNKTAEDEEEEERKKKLTDTAKNLLSKIKKWNAEKSCSKDNLQQNCNINEELSKNNCKHNEEKSIPDDKPKRIAHSKKVKLVKSRRKTFCQPPKAKARYDVNKETVKDFQNRIQHKLIEEIMQMPKENLQNVLNDPKINPIMELKMSRLVRENRPLIAQKLRALAESKIKSLDYFSNPQLLIDIDKLIDPVIETDLSVLPHELIKQMENVFQVQFDYSQNNEVSQDTDVYGSAIDNVISVEVNNHENIVKTENNEDLSLYECSTDEDEEITAGKSDECDQKHSYDLLNDILIQEPHELCNKPEEIKQKTSSSCSESHNIETYSSPSKVSFNKGEKSPHEHENTAFLENHLSSENLQSSQYVPEIIVPTGSKSTTEFSSTCCQTDCVYEDQSTQTQNSSNGVETLYGVPIPQEATDDNISSLIKEVNSIQNLTNKLNERRFLIFLQLARMSPSGNFITNDDIKKNFIETISNGNILLVEALKKFFSVNQRKNHKRLEYDSSGNSSKAPRRWKSKNRPKNREDKRNTPQS